MKPSNQKIIRPLLVLIPMTIYVVALGWKFVLGLVGWFHHPRPHDEPCRGGHPPRAEGEEGISREFTSGGGRLVPVERYDDLIVTTALLLGAEPLEIAVARCSERAKSRMYWSIRPAGGPDAYGHTKVEACNRWLLKKGIKINTRTGQVEKCIPHSFLSYLEK